MAAKPGGEMASAEQETGVGGAYWLCVTFPKTAGRAGQPWWMLVVAAAAMVGTLPGRTQGLGLITEPLLKDLGLERVAYADINLWATLIGALFCLGVGQLQDKLGSRLVLTAIAAALGAVVLATSRTHGGAELLALLTLTRGLGQSALSVVSLAIMGKWFRKGLERVMAIYTVVLSIGFMIAFPLVSGAVKSAGWRSAWGGIGWALLLGLTPIALLLVGREPRPEPSEHTDAPRADGATLAEALQTPAFWVMAVASATYGLVASGIGLFNEAILKERGFSAETYYNTLVIGAFATLIGNFVGGFLARIAPMQKLMAVAMAFLMAGLVALPLIHTYPQAIAVAMAMGIAGGFVMVLFFAFWGQVYGRAHLGKIQGAAQTVTVVASALGPEAIARWGERHAGSYAGAFWWLAGLVGLLALAAHFVRTETRWQEEPLDDA